MTGQPFLRALLGSNAAIAFEAAFGADLTDVDGSGWTWTDLGSDPRHDPGVPIVVGRSDNVGQAGAATFYATLNNPAGNYTPGNPVGANYPNVAQNTPVRERMTLDGSTWFTRFQGYLDSANPVTDQSAKVKGVVVTALGALGRIGGKKKPLRSPMYRISNITAPSAWWPMEEGALATSFASAIAGGPALTIAGTVAPGSDGNDGASASGDFSGGGSAAAPLSLPITTSFRVSMMIQTTSTSVDAFGNCNNAVLQLGTVGALGILEFGFNKSTLMINAFIGAGGFFGVTVPVPATATGPWYSIIAEFVTSGGNTNCQVWINGTSTTTVGFTGNVTAVTSVKIGAATVIGITDGDHAFKATALTIWSPWAGTLHVDQAAFGYVGETADTRLTRLCAEQGIALDLTGTSNVTMGPQATDTILNLLRECEAADHGVLYDGLGPGIGYQCRSARYNAATALTLDMGANPPQVTTFAPVFDRQAVKNLYVVSRKNGGSWTAEQTDGPLGTDLIGVEDGAATVNTDSDAVLPGHAGWLILLGTVPGFRFPLTGLNLRGIPSKAADVLGLSIGDRITIINPASKATDLPPDSIDLIVEGWIETTSASTWALALNCSPYAPNVIATVNDTAGRIDSTNSTTGTTWTTTVTGSKFVAVPAANAWTTAVGDFPLDIVIGGERITVSAIAAWAGGGQNFTVSARSVNGVVKTHAVGEAVHVATPLVIGL